MAFSFFKSIKSRGNIGLDIGTSSIKIVELEKRGGRVELLNYGIFELEGADSSLSNQVRADGWQNILKMPDQDISEGIRDLIKKAGIDPSEVVASIPSFSTFATVIEMPYVSDEDLARALPFEAKKYVPIPLDDVILDWSIVGVIDGQSQIGVAPSLVEVFLAAVPKEETSRYQNIMKNAGLHIRALELENSALIRGLLGNDLSSAAVVNIGGRSTSISIIKRGYERISHNYEVGGFEITRAISRSLGVSLEKAEELKRRLGLKKVGENAINESTIPLIDMMIFETKKTIAIYEESSKDKVANIILIGGLANMPGFSDYFKEKLGRNVTVGNPFARITYPVELEPIMPELKSTLAVAIGLAMRDI